VAVQAGYRNVYADLVFPNPNAMLRKARITSEISAILKKARLTHIAAARRIRVPQATFVRVMRGEFTQAAEGTLSKWRARLAAMVDPVRSTRSVIDVRMHLENCSPKLE